MFSKKCRPWHQNCNLKRPLKAKPFTLLRAYFLALVLLYTGLTKAEVHPLRLSLCEVEYSSKKQLLTINLKLFLTDVNEAIVFDPYSKELAFCQPNESPKANKLLMDYVNRFFHVKANSQLIDLKVKRKKLSG